MPSPLQWPARVHNSSVINSNHVKFQSVAPFLPIVGITQCTSIPMFRFIKFYAVNNEKPLPSEISSH